MLFKQQSNTFFLATLQSKADCKFGRRIYSYLYLLLNKPYNYLSKEIRVAGIAPRRIFLLPVHKNVKEIISNILIDPCRPIR